MNDMNFYKKIVLIALLCIVACNQAMEKDSIIGKGNIKSEKDIMPFIRQVVAYQRRYDKFIGFSPWDVEDCYPGSVYYGYVEDKGFGSRSQTKEYMLDRPLSKDDRGFLSRNDENYIVHVLRKIHPCLGTKRYCYYYNSDNYCCYNAIRNCTPKPSKILHPGHFYGEIEMRNITQKEAIDILKIINEKNARFSYWVAEEFSLPNIVEFLEQLGK
jgi:hypothetical protein